MMPAAIARMIFGCCRGVREHDALKGLFFISSALYWPGAFFILLRFPWVRFPQILTFSLCFLFSPIIKSADSILFPLKILHFAKACTAPLQDGLRRCSVCGAAFATPFGALTC